MSICELALTKFCKNNNMFSNAATVTLEDVCFHARRCLSHSSIIQSEVIDTLRGKLQNLQASGCVGTTTQGASIYAPSHLKDITTVSSELLKWIKLKPGDVLGYEAEPVVPARAEKGFSTTEITIH